MHSTRKPPFAPPPLPGEDNHHEITNVVRLRQDRRHVDSDPAQNGDEPPWRQAFVLADGVKATRTPDRVIRARNGHTEPPVTTPEDPAFDITAASGKSAHSIIGAEAIETPEPAVRTQIAELRSAVASEGSVSERLTFLADKEAALADEASSGEATLAPHRMIETATRLPGGLQAPAPVYPKQSPETSAGACRHGPQPGDCRRVFLVAGHVLWEGWHPPDREFGCTVGGCCRRDNVGGISVAVRPPDEDGDDPLEAAEPEYTATVDAALQSEPVQDVVIEPRSLLVAAGKASPADPVTGASDAPKRRSISATLRCLMISCHRR